ncbi:MAG: MFS transporter [Lachnospiraceae bacterium]
MRRKNNIFIFLAVAFLQSLAANFAHPITPTLIVNLNLRDYMFGAAFAAMSFTNFLFSPFWGKMRDFFSTKKLLLVGCIGYAFGQFLFSIMKTEVTILLARCFSGFFVGAVNVSTLVYIMDSSEEDRVGENLTRFAIVQAVGAAFGYFIGGVIGVYSIKLTFLIQSLTLAASGILFVTLPEDCAAAEYQSFNRRTFVKEINPLKAFLDTRSFMTRNLAFLFMAVVFANIGTNAFDQCFNYYLKDQFQFTSIYNGVMKAVTGIITLVVNGTLCMWIIRKTRVKRSVGIILAGCAVSIAMMLSVNHIILFFAICIVFYSFNAAYIPLLQASAAKSANNSNGNMVMGFYNATKSLGMICGALIAGLLYQYSSDYPFVLAAVCFAAAALILLTTASERKRRSGKVNQNIHGGTDSESEISTRI